MSKSRSRSTLNRAPRKPAPDAAQPETAQAPITRARLPYEQDPYSLILRQGILLQTISCLARTDAMGDPQVNLEAIAEIADLAHELGERATGNMRD